METIGLCSDHAGFELKEFIKQLLDSKGIAYKDFGTYSTDSCDYSDYAHPLAKAITAKAEEKSIGFIETEEFEIFPDS